MNKKAFTISHDLIMWFIKIALLVTIAIFTRITISLLVVNDVGIEHIRAEAFSERALLSPGCLTYYNEDSDTYEANIIELSKFEEEETLKKCIDYGDKKIISAKLTLKNLDKPEEDPTIVFYNKDKYEQWEPFTFDQRYYLKDNEQRYVLIKDNGKTYRARLQIEVVTPVG